MKMFCVPMIMICLFGFNLAHAQSNDNLLKNGDIQAGSERQVPGWTFSDWLLKPGAPHGEEQAKVTNWGVKDDGKEGKCLWIATSSPVQSHVWWQQEIKAEGGSAYTLSVRVKGGISHKTWGSPEVALYFTGDGEWLGSEGIKEVEWSDDWKTWTETITAPENTLKIGVRLGIHCLGIADAFFRDVVLTKEGAAKQKP